jgi:hypothetical protein
MGKNIFSTLGKIIKTNVAEVLDEVVNTDRVSADLMDSLDDATRATDDKEGGYYYKVTGEYLGKNETSNNVYVADGVILKKIKDEKDDTREKTVKEYVNAKLLGISNYELLYCAGIVQNEEGDADGRLLIAHTAYNQSIFVKKRLALLLATAYSTVKRSDKQHIKAIAQGSDEKNFKQIYQNAIAAIIDVYMGGPDVSNGSQLWDGEDFLAWGKNRPEKAGGGEFPKLKEGVIIPVKIYNDYLNAVKKDHPSGKIKYSRFDVICSFPNEVFTATENWKEEGTIFSYKTDGGAPTLIATHTRGKSIFWKKIK